MALVEPQALRDLLTKSGASATALAVADAAAETASSFTAAYCTRLRLGDPVPPVVADIALRLAVRIASNPTDIRSVSAEGQSIAYDVRPAGFTYLETVLLNPHRRRTA